MGLAVGSSRLTESLVALVTKATTGAPARVVMISAQLSHRSIRIHLIEQKQEILFQLRTEINCKSAITVL